MRCVDCGCDHARIELATAFNKNSLKNGRRRRFCWFIKEKDKRT